MHIPPTTKTFCPRVRAKTTTSPANNPSHAPLEKLATTAIVITRMPTFAHRRPVERGAKERDQATSGTSEAATKLPKTFPSHIVPYGAHAPVTASTWTPKLT